MFGNIMFLSIDKSWSGPSVAFALAEGIVVFSWLAWGVYVLCSKKTVKVMPAKQAIVIEGLSMVLLLCWTYLATSSLTIVVPFALLFVWQEYRLIKEYKHSKASTPRS